MVHFLITAPHSSCSQKSDDVDRPHTCDYSSAAWAEKLGEYIKNYGVPSSVIYGDQPREQIDLSGPEARESKWRKRIAAKVTIPETVYIEVHSHSPSTLPGVIIKFRPTIKGKVPRWISQVHQALAQHTQVVIYDKASDSVEEYTQMDIPSVYISFEDFVGVFSESEMMDDLADALVN